MAHASLEEFDRHVDKIIRSVRAENKNVWFRGHSKDYYDLKPSLMRQNNGRGVKYEAELYAEFVRNATNKSVNNSVFPQGNDWEILSLMRHYGMPTRLLDWTTNREIAFYFALCEKTQDPCVWVLNPYGLNALTTGYNVIFDEVDPLMLNGKPMRYYDTIRVRPRQQWPFERPLAMAPAYMNYRIQAQFGAFTLHGYDDRSIDKISSSNVQKISIPSYLRKPLWRRLMKSGRNGGSIYPDLFGVAVGLREQFNLRK